MKRSRESLLAAALAIALMAIHVYGSAYSAAIQDTARDVFYAYSIRHGLWFPREGPILGGAIHLGPVWFYVLSLPLWLQESWLSIALFAGFLAALKFPLAMAAGARFVDLRFGILWACFLALPSWNTLEQLIFFNVNPAAAVVLGTILAWDACIRAPRPIRFFALGLLASLALHVHPTTAPLLALLLHAWRKSGWRWSNAAAAAVGIALPLVPYAAHQIASGVPDLGGATSYVVNQVSLAGAWRLPALLWSTFVAGPAAILAYIWHRPTTFLIVAVMVVSAAIAPIVVGAAKRTLSSKEQAMVRALLAATVAFALCAAVLRPTTPWYFTYALAPFPCGLLAAGTRRLIGPSFAAVVLASITSAAAMAAVTYRLADTVRSGEGVLNSRILDVTQPLASVDYADTWFPAAGRSALGRFLCARADGTTLHGHLAYIEDRSVGVDALLECRSFENIRIAGGGNDAKAWVGMSRVFWGALHASPECWAGSLGIVRATHVESLGPPIRIADGRAYFPRPRSSHPLQHFAHRFTASGEALLVTNPFLGYSGLSGVRVRANGVETRAVAHNDLSWLFAPPTSGANTTWDVDYDASDDERVDLAVIEGTGKALVPSCDGVPPP